MAESQAAARSRRRISRRSLLGGFGVAGAAVVTGPLLLRRGSGIGRQLEADVLVVGAGLSGLVAARRLAAAGCSVVVAEATDGVGGRSAGLTLGDGQSVDALGHWIAPRRRDWTAAYQCSIHASPGSRTTLTAGAGAERPSRLMALAAEVGGVHSYPVMPPGRTVALVGGLRREYDGALLDGPLEGAGSASTAFRLLGMMAAEIDPAAPWRAVNARERDEVTLGSWIDANVAAPGRWLVTLAAEVAFGAAPSEMSLLHALTVISSTGGPEVLRSLGGGPQRERFAGGTRMLAERLADALGERLRLGATVRRISQDPTGALAEGEGVHVRAQHVVVAAPVAATGRIEFTPSAASNRQQLAHRSVPGSTAILAAVYERPFWRDVGLSGAALADAGAVGVVQDATPPTGRPGVLVVVVPATRVRHSELRTAAARQETVVTELTRIFGERAAEPVQIIDQPAHGSTVVTAGALSTFGHALRTPMGHVHWAGRDTAEAWAGHAEGAVRSGDNVADEILDAW